MSLVRLLTAGKSLVGLGESCGRYHLMRKRALPEFGSKKNPFRATTLPAKISLVPPTPIPESESALVETPSQAQKVVPVPAAISPMPAEPAPAPSPTVLAQRAEASSPAGTTAEPGRTSAAPTAPARKAFSRLAEGVRSLSGVMPKLPWKQKSAAPAPSARMAKPMVQGELSLDRVKVVRNDLSESDLEIVPARPTVPKSQPELVAVEAGAGGWSRMAGWFGGKPAS